MHDEKEEEKKLQLKTKSNSQAYKQGETTKLGMT